MTLEEAAKALLERVDKALEYRSGWELMPSIQEAADALRSALSASPWVPCKDALPRNGQIVCVNGGCAMYRDGVWYSGMERPFFQRPIEWAVSHWAKFEVFTPAGGPRP